MMRPGLFSAPIALVLSAGPRLAKAEQPLAQMTVVVYNGDLPESIALAKFYAEKRGIARDHLVALACPKEEEISREEYDTTIAEPLRAIFKERHWWNLRENSEHPEVVSNSIRFVALIKGVPLKIRSTINYPGDKPGAGKRAIGMRPRSIRSWPFSVLSGARFPAR